MDGTKQYCGVCNGDCLIKPGIECVTHQPILTRKELDEVQKKNPVTSITGPDTLLFLWQEARERKDWKNADDIKNKGMELGFKVSFCTDHYEVH